MQRKRGQQQNWEDQKSLKENRDTKGIFHAKMGPIKDRNAMGLTKAEDIKKRQQQFTEELYKKDLQHRELQWCDHSPRAEHSGM